MFHTGQGRVHQTLRRLAECMDRAGVDYCIIGAMALNAHGFARETTDVDVLITPEGLDQFRERFEGRGYRPAFEGAHKTFRDVESNVQVEFVITGDYPGDGKPKPVAFPPPAQASNLIDGVRVAGLPKLIELKLASGMTDPGRLRDLADVQDLIRILHLPESMADQLDPYVRGRFLELLRTIRNDAAPRE